jgi:hypothetical protein
MPAFSKPVPPSAAETTKTGRKRTLNPKITSEDNVHADAVKRRKLEQAKSGNSTTSGSHVNAEPKNPQNPTLPVRKTKATPKAKPKSRQASVEDSYDLEDIYVSRNDGPSKNPNANLEAAADLDETDVIDLEDDGEEEEANNDDVQQETDEQQLGIVKIQSWNCFINSFFRTTSKRMAVTNLCLFQT